MSDVHRPYVVFGNVDETLITVNSMFDFPHYQLVCRPGTADEVPGQASRTRSSLSMLELVGRPVAVRGDGELREHLPAQAASVRI